MSRAAVIERPVVASEGTSKSRGLVLLMVALLIVVLGLRLDNTILYGNATRLSIVAHGFAIELLALGIWRLFR
jgi:hypothetical protein